MGNKYHAKARGGSRYFYMRDFAKEFYQSKAWKKTRHFVFERDFGLCCRCGKPGDIVHHKIHLTPANIDDPSISLNVDNLETLCRDCHAAEHEGTLATDSGLTFDENGDLIERSEAS